MSLPEASAPLTHSQSQPQEPKPLAFFFHVEESLLVTLGPLDSPGYSLYLSSVGERPYSSLAMGHSIFKDSGNRDMGSFGMILPRIEGEF